MDIAVFLPARGGLHDAIDDVSRHSDIIVIQILAVTLKSRPCVDVLTQRNWVEVFGLALLAGGRDVTDAAVKPRLKPVHDPFVDIIQCAGHCVDRAVIGPEISENVWSPV